MTTHTIAFKPASPVYTLTVTTTNHATVQLVPNGGEQPVYVSLYAAGTTPVYVQIRNASNRIAAQAVPPDGGNYDGVLVGQGLYPIVVPAGNPDTFITAIAGAAGSTLYAQLVTPL